MATKFRFIYNGVSSDFDDYYVRTDLFNQEQIWSFGSNNLGQLGDNTIVSKSSPIQEITFGVNWKQFSVNSFSSGIKTDGTLWTWGPNTFGQLGDNSIIHRSSAVQTVALGSNWYSIANGYQHTLAVKSDSTLWSWGRNSYGQLGSDVITHRSSPTQTIAVEKNWTYVAGGYQHSLAGRSDSSIWSFGRNNFGQLGTGLFLHRSSPTQTLGYANNWSSVGTSGSHTAGVKSDGTLWVCGSGTSGQLGDGTSVTKSSPVQVVIYAENWSSVDYGVNHGTAIKTDGTLWCWGYNLYGQLGDNTTTSKSSPVQTIAGGTNWSKVACGYSNTVAAIKTDGTLWSWGDNSIGQLGDNTRINRSSPVQTIAGGTTWSSLSFRSAIKTDGTLWTWGLNTNGQLGDNTTVHRSSPVQTIAGGTNWSSVSAGIDLTGATKTDGTLWTWGLNTNGQLGHSTTVHKSSPVQTIAGGINWSSVACGRNYIAGIKTDGTLWTWGRNYGGRLGDNTAVHRSSPVQTIARGTTWSKVSCGYHTAGIKTDGTLWTWGVNLNGRLGDNTTSNRSSPIQTIVLGTNWSSVTANGYAYTAAIKKDGTLWTWGYNLNGQLGDNTITNRSSPVQPLAYAFSTNWSNVKVELLYSSAIKKDGTLWSWGSGTSGQLGNNRATSTSLPVQEITYSTIWSQLSAGRDNTAAIKTDGTLWTWGRNSYGNLGDNTQTDRSSPVQTATFGSTWSSISCGKSHVASVKTDGTLWLWGQNSYGKLGDNTAITKSSPIQTITFGTTWSKASAGFNHTGAIKTDGTAWTWGLGTSGQLGDGTVVTKSSPVQVVVYATTWSSPARCHSANNSACVKSDGTLWVWGDGSEGALGDNTITTKSSPIQTITFGSNWSTVECGYKKTAAIKTDGTLWMWGHNISYGALGDNTTISKSSPVQTVTFGTNWSSVSTSTWATAAVKTNGTLWIWGSNQFGQLGDNTSTSAKSSPVQTVGFATNWSKVSVGRSHVGAIKTDGTLWVWGYNTSGQLGDNTVTNRSSPIQTVTFGTNWNFVSCGNYHTLATKTDGTLWVWGRNYKGCLGEGTITHRSSPIQTIAYGTNWNNIAAGINSIATKTDGTLWVWGNNSSSQLGDTTLLHRSSPIQTVALGNTWSKVGGGDSHYLATKTDGTLWAWGNNGFGISPLGDGTVGGNRSYPIQPLAYSFATNWSNIACGTNNTAATKTDGTLWTWGISTNGSLGNNLVVNYSVPIQTIAYGTNWSQTNFSNFGNTVAAMRTDNTLWTFGTNTNGQLLVDLAAADLSSPVQILPGTTWLQFSAGKFHSAFVKSDKTLWSSGDNTYGQLATNTSGAGPYVYPTQEVSASTSWKQTACGDNHTMTVKTDGTLWGWGYNAYGQLGDNTATTKSSPVQTFGSANTWKQVACGSNHTVAAKIDGTVWTWGKGTQGQLGTNTITHRSSPIQTVAYGSNWWKVAAGYNNTTALFNYNVTL